MRESEELALKWKALLQKSVTLILNSENAHELSQAQNKTQGETSDLLREAIDALKVAEDRIISLEQMIS